MNGEALDKTEKQNRTEQHMATQRRGRQTRNSAPNLRHGKALLGVSDGNLEDTQRALKQAELESDKTAE